MHYTPKSDHKHTTNTAQVTVSAALVLGAAVVLALVSLVAVDVVVVRRAVEVFAVFAVLLVVLSCNYGTKR